MRYAVPSLSVFALIRQTLSQINTGPPVFSFIANPNPASFGQPFSFSFNRLQGSTDGSDPTTLTVEVFFTSTAGKEVDDAPRDGFNITIGEQTSGMITQDSSGTPFYKLDTFDGIGEYDIRVFDFDGRFQGELDLRIEQASSNPTTPPASKTTATQTSGTGNGGSGNTQTSGGTTQTSDPQGSASSDPSATSSTDIGSSTVSGSGSAIQATSSSSGGTVSPGTSSDPTSGISTDSSTTPSPSSTQNAAALVAASHNHTGAIAGGVIGGVIALLLLIGDVILLRRRSKSSRDLAELQANKDVEPYDVGYGSSAGIIPRDKRPVTLTSGPLFSSDQKSSVPVNTTRGEKRPTNPVLPGSSENSQSTSSSPSNVLSLPAAATVPVRQSRPQSIITERQFQLQEREERNLRELATLEERIAAETGTGAEADLLSPSGANEGGQDMVMVARSEHEATTAEMRRLREENMWLRDAQQSDWAMGLSDEMPPPYQGRMDEG